MTDSSNLPINVNALRDATTLAEAHDAIGMSPSYDGPCRLLDWSQSARFGMTVDIKLVHPGPLGGHPLRGMEWGRERGQRFRIAVSMPRQHDGDSPPIVHAGEALLLKWSEDGANGMMARLLLDDGPDGVQGRHPFFGLSVGNTKGDPLEATLWAITENEMPISPSKVKKRTPFHQLSEVQQSGILCRQKDFQTFLTDRLSRLVTDDSRRESLVVLLDNPEQFALAAVREILGVPTRAVMNKDGTASQNARVRWHKLRDEFDDMRWGVR